MEGGADGVDRPAHRRRHLGRRGRGRRRRRLGAHRHRLDGRVGHVARRARPEGRGGPDRPRRRALRGRAPRGRRRAARGRRAPRARRGRPRRHRPLRRRARRRRPRPRSARRDGAECRAPRRDAPRDAAAVVGRPPARPLRRLVRALPPLLGRLPRRGRADAAAGRARLRRGLPPARAPDRRDEPQGPQQRARRRAGRSGLPLGHRPPRIRRPRRAASRPGRRNRLRGDGRRGAGQRGRDRRRLRDPVFGRPPLADRAPRVVPPSPGRDAQVRGEPAQALPGHLQRELGVARLGGPVVRPQGRAPRLGGPRGPRLPGRQPPHKAVRVLGVAHPGGPRRRPRRHPPRRGVHPRGEDARARRARLHPVLHVLHLEERELGAPRVRPAPGARPRRRVPPELLRQHARHPPRVPRPRRRVGVPRPAGPRGDPLPHLRHLLGFRGVRERAAPARLGGVPRLGEVRGQGAHARRPPVPARPAAERRPPRASRPPATDVGRVPPRRERGGARVRQGPRGRPPPLRRQRRSAPRPGGRRDRSRPPRPAARLRGARRADGRPLRLAHRAQLRAARAGIRPRAEPRVNPARTHTHWFEADPLWFKRAVFYEIHIRGFFDGDGDGSGDFRGLIEKLDYLQWLGVDCLWLLPMYDSPLRDGGYDIAAYQSIHPDYGTVEDFRAFVEAAHQRGMRVIADLVLNHTSSDHPWFQESRSSPDSPKRDWYVWSDSPQVYEDARIIFVDTEPSNWTWDPVAGAYYWHRFFSHQPDLNFDNPEVQEAMIENLRFWLDAGIDGFRLDAVPYLFEREGTICENLPETHDYLKRVRREVDERYPDRVLLAEANQWPADVVEYFGDGDECHMAFHFPVMPRMFMALRREDATPIYEILDSTPAIPENCQWGLFLRNHDELTLEMVTDEERDYMYAEYAKDPRMKLNLGIRRRLAPLLDGGRDEAELMHAILFSLPGSPVLYYGDEIGMGDNVYLGDRDGVRTPMQWTGDRNAGFSRADFAQLYLPPLMDPVYGYQALNIEAELRQPTSFLRWIRRFVALRKEHPVFGLGTYEPLATTNHRVFAHVRAYEDDVVLCVHNLARSAQSAMLDLGRWAGRTPVEMLGNSAFPPIGELPYLLTFAPRGFYWFSLRAPEEGEAE